MKRKRPESTIYLGDEVLAKLQAYRRRFPHPPSLSAIVREAVEQYMSERPTLEEVVSPSGWVKMTEAHVTRLRFDGVSVSTDAILNARRQVEEDRIGELLRGEER